MEVVSEKVLKCSCAGGQDTELYTFTGGADGGNPFAGVINDAAGTLYGTTFDGGEIQQWRGIQAHTLAAMARVGCRKRDRGLPLISN